MTVFAINLPDKDDLVKASDIFTEIMDDDGVRFDYYSNYISTMEFSGLLIFISGFLGLVFLISTGSILYFKQMTEAEQERSSYATLRQLGFTAQDIMRGIVRKQVFVFGVAVDNWLTTFHLCNQGSILYVHVGYYLTRIHRNGHLRAHLSRLCLPDSRILSENGEGCALRVGWNRQIWDNI